MKKDIKFPVMEARMVDIDLIDYNDYNPNKTTRADDALIIKSLEKDGYTEGMYCYHDKQTGRYMVIDGEHRTGYAVNRFGLKQIPVIVADEDKTYEDCIASTIRHNRAHGTHGITEIARNVQYLSAHGWDDAKICDELGMRLDEVMKLKIAGGLKEVFKGHHFSRSWEEFDKKVCEEEGIE